jgi:hypothetical protein
MIYRLPLAIALVGLSASLSPADSIPGQAIRRGSAPSLAGTIKNPVAVLPAANPGEEMGLEARRPLPKRALDVTMQYDPKTGERLATGRIVVKFRDELKVRVPRAPIDRPASDIDPQAADEVAVVLAKHGGLIEQWINRTPEQLAALERRAAEHSGRAQPDLAGMTVVTFPRELSDRALQAAAVELQSLAGVEFAALELHPRLDQCGQVAAPEANPNCAQSTPPAPGTLCNAPSLSCCGAVTWLPGTELFECNGSTPNDIRDGNWGCRDATCCELVATFLPYCDDQDSPNGWDVYCAGLANLLCAGTLFDQFPGPGPIPANRYNPCFTDVAGTAVNPIFAPILPGLQPGNCLEPTANRGCGQPLCCFDVCTVDPTCCTVQWDAQCVSTAFSTPRCQDIPTPSITPEFTELQPYLSDAPYAATPGQPLVWNGAAQYRGQGFALEASAAPNRTLPALLEQLETAYGLGPQLPFGKSVNVAVIEFSAFVNHEDFVLAEVQPDVPSAINPALWTLRSQPKVIPEPGQTILLIEGANNAPQHGTAALGQIVAARQEQGTPGTPGYQPEVGGRGLAYEAQGWFFPIVSVEEGNRTQNAFVSCYEIFGPGDVVNCSFGSGGGNTVPSQPALNTLIRVGTDLGITTVCSAGNDGVCVLPQPVDSGAMVIGASSPGTIIAQGAFCQGMRICAGFRWRLGFSNFTDSENAEFDDVTGWQLNRIDVSAWGSNVTTTGYGDLNRGEVLRVPAGAPGFPAPGNNFEANQLRSYTETFNGTSSAAPMISGVVANLQAASKQAFGGPMSPFIMRSIVAGNGPPQCEFSGTPEVPCDEEHGPDCCDLNAGDCIFNSISNCSVNLYDAGVAIFTQGPANNPTEIKVITGFPVDGPAASIYIRAADSSYLRLGTEQANVGDNVEGLRYLVTGPTTDIYAKLESSISNPNQIENLGLIVQGRSTAQVAIVGGFLYNYPNSRWDFIGVGIYGPASQQNPIVMPVSNALLSNYVDSAGVFRARVWTCGLGLSGPHQIWHDLIEIGVNDPVLVPPGP